MDINPAMLALLRDVRGLTQEDVATAAGLRQPYLSQIHTGSRSPSDEAAERIAGVLDVPVSLLADATPIRGGEAGDLHFRRRKTLPVRERRKLEGKLHLIYLTIRGLLRGVDYESTLPLPQIDMDEYEDPTEAARYIRRLWRIPAGPVRNLTGYLESAGMFFVEVHAPNKVDAVTRRGDHGWHATAVRKGTPGDRDRLTRAHEFAHLVRHERAFGDDTEDDANAFAAELLAPADEIEPDLYGITPRHFGRLLDLRLHWGVSLPFLVRHARRLDCISERTATSLYTALNARGWQYGTVDDRVPKEPPTLLSQIVAVHRDDHGFTVGELATLAEMTPARFMNYFGFEGGQGPPRRLTRVQ